MNRKAAPVDAAKLFPAEDRRSGETLMTALEKRFVAGRLRGKQAGALRDYLAAEAELNDEVVLNAIRLVLSTPEFQLT
jgi:hypothetical protein